MLDQFIADSVYRSAVGSAAVYVDSSGDRIPVRVVRVMLPAELAALGDAAARGLLVQLQLRRSEIPDKPQKGDIIETQAAVYVVDDVETLSAVEWLIYAND